MAETSTESFATQHRDDSGFTALPRWWMGSSEWKSLDAGHRGVILELFLRIARLPWCPDWLGWEIPRGQAVMSYATLAKWAGTKTNTARRAVKKAIEAGWVIQETLTVRHMA